MKEREKERGRERDRDNKGEIDKQRRNMTSKKMLMSGLQTTLELNLTGVCHKTTVWTNVSGYRRRYSFSVYRNLPPGLNIIIPLLLKL